MNTADETLRNAITENKNLAYIVGQTETISPIGKHCLLDSRWLTDAADMEREYNDTDELRRHISGQSASIDRICLKLMCLRDITSTLKALAAAQTLGDIELYELKALALIITDIRTICKEIGLKAVDIPEVGSVVDILDPEKTRVAQFYVYDRYSERLKELRTELREAQKRGEEEKAAELFARCSDEETRIRRELTQALFPYYEDLTRGMEALGRLDLLIARARLANSLSLTRPVITDKATCYTGLRNPQIEGALKQNDRQFQPVDIEIPEGVTVITGANMAGKSVVLKTVGLSQQMAQFGFHVPACQAYIRPVDEVLSSIGDAQDELEGLSSYAAEMLRINNIVKKKREGVRCLALIDEPARTTNPEEGKALVNALLELLGGSGSQILVTTHYSGLSVHCRRLRVRGFREEMAAGHTLTASTVNDFIDYSLEPNDETEVPHEALRIARLIGVDASVYETARKYLDR